MIKSVPYQDMSDGWAYVGFCRSSVALRTGDTNKKLTESELCLHTNDSRDVAEITLGVCLVGAVVPIYFKFDGQEMYKTFLNFISDHVDVSQALSRFEPTDSLRDVTEVVVRRHTDPDWGNYTPDHICEHLSMLVNQRLARAVSEQLQARALLQLSPDRQTLAMALQLTTNGGDRETFGLSAQTSDYGETEIAHHLGNAVASVLER